MFPAVMFPVVMFPAVNVPAISTFCDTSRSPNSSELPTIVVPPTIVKGVL